MVIDLFASFLFKFDEMRDYFLTKYFSSNTVKKARRPRPIRVCAHLGLTAVRVISSPNISEFDDIEK